MAGRVVGLPTVGLVGRGRKRKKRVRREEPTSNALGWEGREREMREEKL